MDVTCNRCSTEYEFEEALVSPRGTAVRCTQCGHLFKVQRVPRAGVPAPGTHWTVRQTDGSTQTLDDLSQLPRLIREGSFGRDDELSRTGRLWRRLGNIDELEEHFVEADRRGPSRSRSQRDSVEDAPALTPAQLTDRHPPAQREDNNAAPAETATTANATAAAAPNEADLLHRTPPPVSPSRPRARKKSSKLKPPRRRRDSRPSWAGVEAFRSTNIQHESRRHAWTRLLASAAIAAGLAFWFFSVPPSASPVTRMRTETRTDPSARFIAAAQRALSAYRIERFDTALVEYIKALAYHEHDAHILSSVSRVHALWAQAILADVELNKLEPTTYAHAQTEALLRQVAAHAQQAKHYAELAVRDQPNSAEAQLARSDALRLAGELPTARAALNRAIKLQTRASAETLRVSALLALAEASVDNRAAVKLAAQAVAADPHWLCARLLLARLLLTHGDLAGARAQIETIRKTNPQHPMVLRLQALAVGAAQAAVAAADSAAQRSASNTPERESYIKRGRALLEAGQLGAAKRMFDHALTLQPDSAPAHAGLGQVAIARGRPLQAIDHFVAAALAGDGESLIALADTYRRLGRQREALTAYQSYLQQNPHGAQLDVAKAQLERLDERFASARKP